MCPAAGQGALAIEIRKDDSEVREHVAFLDDAAARASTTCERALLNKMGGGCQVPIGAFAEVLNDRLHLEAIVARPDGTRVLRESGDGDDPVELGESSRCRRCSVAAEMRSCARCTEKPSCHRSSHKNRSCGRGRPRRRVLTLE